MTQTLIETECVQRLTNDQRDDLMHRIDRDGYAQLPGKLTKSMIDELIAAIDRVAAVERTDATAGVKVNNCIDRDSAFRGLMMHEPALQLVYDAFGPMFHLCQSNFVVRPREKNPVWNFVDSSPWHADGPRPAQFPKVGGAMGMHYLKFGFFLTDLTHGNGGPLQVVRGSHRRPELDAKGGAFRIEDYANDLVTFNCEAGTVVAFHQAQWHAAPPNRSDIVRKNVYISYCPTWMRPLDRELPTSIEQLAGLTDEERWLLAEPRPAMRWWLPRGNDTERMSRFRRDGASVGVKSRNYE